MNRIVLSGRATGDATWRQTQNSSVCNFSIAAERPAKGNEKNVDFLPIVAWGAQAEYCKANVRKGTFVVLTGYITTRSYEQDGKRQYKTEVVASEIEAVGGGNHSAPRQREPGEEDYSNY